MKERPILFSAPMIRALLDDSKTQTRRIAKVTEDAKAEGIEKVSNPDGWRDYMSDVNSWGNPVISYLSLWEKINGKKSLEGNPFVWVIEFKVLEVRQ